MVVLDSAAPEDPTIDNIITWLINEDSQRSMKNAEVGESALTAYNKGKQGTWKQGKQVILFQVWKEGHFANQCQEVDVATGAYTEDLFTF
jgi:hypothetical protein